MSITVEGPIEVPPGLRNVVVTTTELGDVRGQEGFYHYRQYSAIELARSKTMEDVWFLVLEGRLPSEAERARFVAEIASLRVLPAEVKTVLPAIALAGEVGESVAARLGRARPDVVTHTLPPLH